MKKVMSQAERVRGMIGDGASNAEITRAVPKATLQQIYNQRYQIKKKLEEEKKENVARQIRDTTKYPIAITPKEDKPANEVQVGGTHYKEKELQPWDAITTWGCGFLDGNVIKYVVRYRSKGGVEDLKKARHYLDKLIELMGAKK